MEFPHYSQKFPLAHLACIFLPRHRTDASTSPASRRLRHRSRTSRPPSSPGSVAFLSMHDYGHGCRFCATRTACFARPSLAINGIVHVELPPTIQCGPWSILCYFLLHTCPWHGRCRLVPGSPACAFPRHGAHSRLETLAKRSTLTQESSKATVQP